MRTHLLAIAIVLTAAGCAHTGDSARAKRHWLDPATAPPDAAELRYLVDRDTGRGKPFHYYAYGAAVSEVELEQQGVGRRVWSADPGRDVDQPPWSTREGIDASHPGWDEQRQVVD